MTILEIKRGDWATYLRLVSEYLANGSVGLWLEEPDGRVRRLSLGLPFTSIDLQAGNAGHGAIEVILRGHAMAPQTFRIDAPLRLWLSLAEDGWVDGLLIEDQREYRTLVRFESGAAGALARHHSAFLAAIDRGLRAGPDHETAG
jgi:hypothetical protein